MADFLSSLQNSVIAGIVLAGLLLLLYLGLQGADGYTLGAFLFRWLHVISGIMWVGLIWFVNVVQIPNMGRIPDEQKPAIGRVIAPAVLWWFRWTALATVVTGLVLATLNGYAAEALSLGLVDGVARHGMIGVGMWLGLVMAFNVWFILWPNQRRALGLVEADADGRTRSARRALLVARINNLLSLPMLFAMVAAQNLF
jgi:uncharacterized membrane protein